jgi:PPK2 family polyphosphate:nucleotide phosphotransferase
MDKLLDDYLVPHYMPGARKAQRRFGLADIDPAAKPCSSGSKSDDKARLAELGKRIDAMQDRLRTQKTARVLLLLQGMDTSGKDGTIRGVFHETDPLGLRVVSFRAPSEAEAAHDFLWRVHQQAPAGGEMVIFNRSHYEDVLVPRVTGAIDHDECVRRYEHIRQFELLLAQTSTTIVKCFLHISKQEQRKRLQARIDDPAKNWKYDPSDLVARRHWDDYRAAYEDALVATSTPHAPWYVIPADSKTHRNVMIAQLMVRVLERLDIQYPPAREDLRGVVID